LGSAGWQRRRRSFPIAAVTTPFPYSAFQQANLIKPPNPTPSPLLSACLSLSPSVSDDCG